jgi:hypothetical protein
VARWWLAQAVWAINVGESPDQAFVQAHHVDAALWVDAYGPVMKRQYGEVVDAYLQQGQAPDATVTLQPLPQSTRVAIDGAERSLDALPAGRRLIQVFTSPEQAVFSRFVRLKPADSVQIQTGLQLPPSSATTALVPPDPTTPLPQAPPARKRPLAPLVIGIAAGTLGAVAWGLAERENAQMRQQQGEALDRAYQRHMAFSGTTVGLLAVGVTGLTLHFTL